VTVINVLCTIFVEQWLDRTDYSFWNTAVWHNVTKIALLLYHLSRENLKKKYSILQVIFKISEGSLYFPISLVILFTSTI